MAAGDVFPKRLGGPTQVSVSATPTTLFTVPSSRQYTIKQIVICNTDGVDRTVTIGIDGVTAALSAIFQLPIGANDTVVMDTGLVLEATETIQGCSDTAAKVTVTITGWDRQTA
jgi:hypothetical protein